MALPNNALDLLGANLLAAGTDTINATIDIAPDATEGWVGIAPACTITGIKIVSYGGAPTTAGTYTIAIAGAGNNLLAAATFDLKTLASGTVTALDLTATSGNLTLAADSLLTATVVSNNADLTGPVQLGIAFAIRHTI